MDGMTDALMSGVVLEVSDFVALANQTLEYAFPLVTIHGELANFRVSKNKWVYFDLKDDNATVRFFGTVFQLGGPLEDGMVLRVRGTPRLHPLYGFSITVSSIRPEGEGTIKRAAELLQAQLTKEGLFDPARKRYLPYPPTRIGLITSTESAAYADFTKILNARWQGIEIECVDVQVQGEAAPGQITRALEYLNQLSELPDVIVLTRGGGSAEDLYAFSTEEVTRAVAASRVPTLVAIGHEIDLSLAELAADRRASTPSNAAELLVPDKRDIAQQLRANRQQLEVAVEATIRAERQTLRHMEQMLGQSATAAIARMQAFLRGREQLLRALNPRSVLKRGYAVVRLDGKVVMRRADARGGAIVNIEVSDGRFDAAVQ